MSELVVLAGMPCAGKTTWAGDHAEPREVASYDYCSHILGGGEQDTGDAAHLLLYELVRARCRLTARTVVDATNLRIDERLLWLSLGKQCRLPVHLVAFFVDLEEAHRRNQAREWPHGDLELGRCYEHSLHMVASIEHEGFDSVEIRRV